MTKEYVIQIDLHREICRKIKKRALTDLTGLRHLCHVASMPSQRHPDKETLSVYLPRTLMRRLRKLADLRKQTVTAVVEEFIYTGTKSVELSPEDYEQIAKETRAAKERQQGKLRDSRRSHTPGDEG